MQGNPVGCPACFPCISPSGACLAQARFPGNQALQAQLDHWVAEHDAAAERKRKAAEDAEDDGWTVVKRQRVRPHGLCYDKQHRVAGGGLLRDVRALAVGPATWAVQQACLAAVCGLDLEEVAGYLLGWAAWLAVSFLRVRIADRCYCWSWQGRQKNTDGEGMSVGGVAAAAAAEAGGKAKQHLTTNFYRFQQRERQRDELFDLRERFEVDKRKIQELKAARRFKPM